VSLEAFPYDILINIARHLDFLSVIRLLRVCKTTFAALNSDSFWTLYRENHPNYSRYLLDGGTAGSISQTSILQNVLFQTSRCLRIQSHLPPPGAMKDRGWCAELSFSFLQGAAAKTGSLTVAMWVRVPRFSLGGIILGYQSCSYEGNVHAQFHEQPLIFSRLSTAV